MRDIVIKPIGKNTQWYTGDKEKDDFFLEAQKNYANELLKFRGFLFLNDVYDMLGYARTKTGQFTIEDAKSVKEIEEMSQNGTLEGNLVSVDKILMDLEEIHLNEKQTKCVLCNFQISNIQFSKKHRIIRMFKPHPGICIRNQKHRPCMKN